MAKKDDQEAKPKKAPKGEGPPREKREKAPKGSKSEAVAPAGDGKGPRLESRLQRHYRDVVIPKQIGRAHV